jgi:hypothetical protein
LTKKIASKNGGKNTDLATNEPSTEANGFNVISDIQKTNLEYLRNLEIYLQKTWNLKCRWVYLKSAQLINSLNYEVLENLET